MERIRSVPLPLVLLLAGLLSAAVLLPSAFGEPGATAPVTREALAQTDQVEGAPQRTLVLSKVTVAPGAELALHHHLGTQIARIASGVLTYTVRDGSVAVRSGESDQHAKLVRTIRAGQTGRIRGGQWIVEQPSAIHQAANRGAVPVVIYLATLLRKGAPPATPVAAQAP